MLRGQVPDPAAEGKATHPGRPDDASGRDEPEGLRRRVQVEPGRATLGAGDPRVGVDLDLPHRREIDHEAAVVHAVPGGVGPASPYRPLQPVRPCEIERRRHVVGADATRDHRRPAVDESVEATARGVVPGIAWGQHGAGERAPQLGRALVHSRSCYRARSYTRITTPSPTVLDSFNRIAFLSLVSPYMRSPVPRITGKIIMCTSSTRSASIRSCTSRRLPGTWMIPSSSSRSFATSSTTSPLITEVLFHSGSSIVDETRYLGIELNLSANGPSRFGHAFAKLSYVTRPISSTSLSRVSSSLNWSPSSPRSKSKLHPGYLNSSPPGASMTPSSETNSVT